MTEYVPRTDDIEFAWVDMRSRMGNGEVAVTGDEEVALREFSGWLAEVIREAKEQERANVMSIVQRRHDDLKGCHKSDDCRLLAEGIWLAIDDVKQSGRSSND